MSRSPSTPVEYTGRPPVSVIVPFLGSEAEAEAMIEALSRLELRVGDELIVADNAPAPQFRAADALAIQVVHAPEQRSAYYARNRAASVARNDWLLFTDADCTPLPDLLDRYFASPPPSRCGALAGEVTAGDDKMLSRYAASRGLLSPRSSINPDYGPAAVTANLMVRAEAWSGVGGFLEGVNSGADTDFCWRLQEAGWTLEHCLDAAVQHRHRSSLGALAKQAATYGAGDAWLRRRHPGSVARMRLAGSLSRCVVGAVGWALAGRLERAAFKLIDGVVITATAWGRLQSNRAEIRGELRHPVDLVVICDSYPRLSETFVREEAQALERCGLSVSIEAVSRPRRPAIGGAVSPPVSYREDDSTLDRLLALTWLVLRHPRGAASLARRRARWEAGGDAVTRLASIALSARRMARMQARHLHAHFATHAALEALRLHILIGLPYSVTAHAHDIFATPTNLAEKLTQAAFVTTGCNYNVTHLRSLLEPPAASRVHKIVMGVDLRRFQRRSPHPNGRSVFAVGRLVEQKGFADLIEAAKVLEVAAPLDRLVIVGTGPLLHPLTDLAERLGISHRVSFMGAREPTEVAAMLETADLLAMPCVVAADGNRDSMPVVVKEAMALELMTVGTDEVGLPEVIRDEWGRLVPPSQPTALADAIAELLALPADARARMGRGAREFVSLHCNVDVEAEKLARLAGIYPGRQGS